MIDPQTLEALQTEYRKAFNTILKTDPLFKGSQENFDAFVRELRRQQIAPEMWKEPVYLSIFMQLKAEGALEFELSDQQKQMERAAFLSARDAEESRSNRRDEEPPGKALARILRDKADATRAEIQAEKERLTALKAKHDAENDLSVVPTIQQIRENGPLSAKEQRKLSAAQLRRYVNNLRRIEAEDAARRQEGQ